MTDIASKALNYIAVLVLLLILLLLVYWGFADAEPILEMSIVAALGVLGVHASANLSVSPQAAPSAAPPAQPAIIQPPNSPGSTG